MGFRPPGRAAAGFRSCGCSTCAAAGAALEGIEAVRDRALDVGALGGGGDLHAFGGFADAGGGKVLLAVDLDEHALLDPAQPTQDVQTADRLVDLEHHGGDKLVALRHQRVIGAQLVRDLLLSALLDVEHLVDLVEHRIEALEIERREWTDLDPAVALDRRHRPAPVAADRLAEALKGASTKGATSARVSFSRRASGSSWCSRCSSSSRSSPTS